MEVPDHNGVGYSRGPQGEVYRSRGQLQRHHTIQTCDDAYVSQRLLLAYTHYTDHKGWFPLVTCILDQVSK